MHVVNGVNKHAVLAAVELLVQLVELVELSLAIEFLHSLRREMPLETIHEVVVLLLEGGPISEVSSSQANAQGLAGICGANSSPRGANCRVISCLL